MKHLPLDNLEEELGHRFANRELLEQALTHSSFARENQKSPYDNEQLEFLGDAVLQFIASEELFARFPSYQEGELSKLRAHLVRARHLASCATELKLGDYLRLGRGEEKTGGRSKAALLADSIEAIIAALYRDGGLAVTRDFVRARILEPELNRLSGTDGEVLAADHKSQLQERLRASGRPEPRYELVQSTGPDHRKTFTMKVIVLDPEARTEFESEGTANSKKAAGQLAAQRALERLQRNGKG